MNIPWTYVTTASLSGSFILVRFIPEYSISTSYFRTFWGLLVVLATAATAWKAVLYPKLFSPLRHLPKPPGGSFLNGQWWRVWTDATGSPMIEWMNTIPNDGLLYYTSFLNDERLVVTTPEAMAEVLSNNAYDYVKPPLVRNALIRIVGEGLVLAEGQEHKHQRKHLSPAFSYRHIKDVFPVFWSKGGELVKALTSTLEETSKAQEKEAHAAPVLELSQWFGRAALDIVGLAGMGQDFGAIQDENTELSKCYRTMLSPTKSRIFLVFLSLFLPQRLVRLIPATHNRNLSGGSEKLKAVALKLIRQRKASWEEGKKRGETDILSVALEAGIFPEEVLVNEAMTFLTAGHETSATALTWAAMELCRHPALQTRLREEIRANLPSVDNSAAFDPDSIDKCHFLAAFCNEVLRFHAPIPITMRTSIKATTIIGQHVPKNTDIIIPIWGANKSIQHWGSDAAEFKPDRWMGPGKAKNGGADSKYSFLTFLHGPRGCIGITFARTEMLWVLAAFVGRFEIEFAEKDPIIEIRNGITMRPKHGLMVRIKPVEGW